MQKQMLDTDQKALEINLDELFMAHLLKSGAGQEVAQSILKLARRQGYCQNHVSITTKFIRMNLRHRTQWEICLWPAWNKMLDHEYVLMEERLQETHARSQFFVFADTVAALNY